MIDLTKEQAIEQIHGRVLAMYKDNAEAAEKCRKILWPNDIPIKENEWLFVFNNASDVNSWAHAKVNPLSQSIPATELLRILEGEWTPEVGKEYEFKDNDSESWNKMKLLAIVNHKYKYICEMSDEDIFCGNFCRPIQKKQITIAELFEKANLDINQYEVK